MFCVLFGHLGNDQGNGWDLWRYGTLYPLLFSVSTVLELKGRILPVSYSLSIGFAAAKECQATECGEQTYTTQVCQ